MDLPTEGNGGDGLQLEQRVAHLERELAVLRAYLENLRASQMSAPRPPQPVSVAAVIPPPLVTPPIVHPPLVATPMSAAPVIPAKPIATPQFNLSASQSKESLESQFGAKVLSKVAIVLLLIGVAWFLKWTFDNHWIGPAGRIIIGLVAGVALVVWSERFRKQKMVAFSYALKAVGTGVLYLSLWAGFHVYHLMPAGVAFALMVGVTLWNAVMAWSQNAEGLAGYALVGAYLTPVLISTGGDHETFLFSYLAVIAASCVALIRLRPWHKLLLGALPATVFFFIDWYHSYFTADHAWLTAFFALLLWGIFAVAPLVAADAENPALTVFVPLGTALFGALSIYSVLADSGGQAWEAWAAVGFAALYLLLGRLRKAAVTAVHIGTAIVFLTVAIQVKATGNGITLGWLVEGLVLIAIASRANLERRVQTAMRWLGWSVLLLGVGMTLGEATFMGNIGSAFLNMGFALSLVAVGALAAAAWFSTRKSNSPDRKMAAVSLVLINLVLLVSMRVEIFRAFTSHQATGSFASGQQYADFCFSGWMLLQGAAMMALGFWKRQELTRWLGLILLAATVLKAVVWDTRTLGTGYRIVSYLALGVVLMAVSFAYQKDWLGLRKVSDGANS